jgi:leucyl aminopeptidase
LLTPKTYRERVKWLAKERKWEFKFHDFATLKKMGAGAFCAVVQADPQTEAGIVRVTYKPKGTAKGKLALVGKGLCFDTGGHNIKTGQYMHTMHRDMTGSAVALATLEALAELGVPYEVEAFLALAENLISPSAFRPNDVVTACDGTTIEVVDTDAEGRMVLSDTLALAAREKPDLVLDFATLTGSAVRSVGTQRSAVFSNRDELLKAAFDNGEATGERVWGFPIGLEYAENIKSDYADILQCANDGPDSQNSNNQGQAVFVVEVSYKCRDRNQYHGNAHTQRNIERPSGIEFTPRRGL